MGQLLLEYDTAFTLAADALFGGSGDQQEHSEKSYTILNALLYTGREARQWVWSDAWCTDCVGREAWSPQLVEG